MSKAEQHFARLADAVELLLERNAVRERDERWRRLGDDLEASGVLTPTPQQFGLRPYLTALPAVARLFTSRVPDEFVSLKEGVTTVACPCGSATGVEQGQLVACDCGRWFLFDGAIVRVALGPKSEVRDAG